MKWISVGLSFFLSLSLVGCSTMNSTVAAPNPDRSKEYIGLFTGAIIGGLAGGAVGQNSGGRAADIGIGVALGALTGFFVGKFADDQDRELAHQTFAPKSNTSTNHLKMTEQRPVNPRPTSSPVVTAEMLQGFTLLGKGAMTKNSPVNKTKAPAAKNEKPQTLTSLWRYLPSRQWFVNDMEQEDVG